MTAEDFRRIALSFAGTAQGAHMHHPDFRVAGTIFATLGYPDAASGMVKLPPGEQRRLMEAMPGIFTTAAGKWGEQGSTLVRLTEVNEAILEHVLALAWQHISETPHARPQRNGAA